MQSKFAKRGFTNTMSGNMNDKIDRKQHKIIDLNDFDVQMLSPQFLQAKTLKKPFSQMGIHLQTTNPNGIGSEYLSRTQQTKLEEQSGSKIIQPTSQQKAPEPTYKYINAKQLNIRPAYKSNNFIEDKNIGNVVEPMQLNFKDKNSIISALFKKGELKQANQIQIKVIQPKKQEGKAEKKLKQLFGRNAEPKKALEVKNEEIKQHSAEASIGEQIIQSIEDDYGNQSFDKISEHYGSLIKESIRESIGGSSGQIKQSIREQIPEATSFRSSHHHSAGQIRQQIKQSVHESFKQSIQEKIKNSAEQIQEEVYQQIFEDVSISDELQKSKTSKFKKSKDYDDKFQLSVSASKGFRTKTNNVVKSIRFAEEISVLNNKKQFNQKLQQKVNKGDKIASELLKQKQKISHLQNRISAILEHKNTPRSSLIEQNQDLFYKFRIQINRLITSQNFSSKLRKLTSFLKNTSSKNSQSIEGLQDKILKNLIQNLETYKKTQITKSDVQAMKNQYDKKLEVMLKDQQIKLRVEMDRKISERDIQYKSMIAQLEKKFSQGFKISNNNYQKDSLKADSDKIEIQSDYSIDSDQISWKADLWELLPDYEKKKLYERQGSQIANFLTDLLVKEVKQQSLDRSRDLSFQFPEDLNVSSSFQSSFPDFKRAKSTKQTQPEIFKSSINREQLMKGVSPQQQQKFPSLTDIKKPKSQTPVQVEIELSKTNQLEFSSDKDRRDTVSVSEVIKILSKYKSLYLKKKNDTIRKVIKTLQLKTKEQEPLSSYLTELRILYDKQISPQDITFVRAYEEELVMQLTGFYNKCGNRKYSYIEEEMRKIYDRYVITCQIKTAQNSVKLPIQIAPYENYIEMRMKQEEKKTKDNIVQQILNILSLQFAKEMPKRKK